MTGTTTLTYDNLDRLTSKANPQGTVNYAYDAVDRRTGMTVVGQPAVGYTYDNADRLTTISQGTSTVSLSFDGTNQRTSVTLPNGIVMQYAYNAGSQLTGITYKLGANVLGDLTYEYNAKSNRTQVAGSYARTGLPTAVTSASYNAANQLTQSGTNTLSYDANGNLLNDGTSSYTWDARDRLASLGATGLTASFQYEPFGNRTQKTINGSTTSFLYDGINPVQELSGGTPTANLLVGLGPDEYFTRTDSVGVRNFLIDALGSTIALADSAGALQTQYTYEPFGNTNITGASSSNSLQYTGRENDGLGLYYYRARYYSPVASRFVSEDPIQFSAGINFYTYTNNNPLNFIDPFGLMPSTGSTCGKNCDKYKQLKRYDLFLICQMFGKEPKENCVRQCLQARLVAGGTGVGFYNEPPLVLPGVIPGADAINSIARAYGPITHYSCFKQCGVF